MRFYLVWNWTQQLFKHVVFLQTCRYTTFPSSNLFVIFSVNKSCTKPQNILKETQDNEKIRKKEVCVSVFVHLNSCRVIKITKNTLLPNVLISLRVWILTVSLQIPLLLRSGLCFTKCSSFDQLLVYQRASHLTFRYSCMQRNSWLTQWLQGADVQRGQNKHDPIAFLLYTNLYVQKSVVWFHLTNCFVSKKSREVKSKKRHEHCIFGVTTHLVINIFPIYVWV